MLVISASEVEALLPLERCIALMRDAMIAVSAGETTLPPRQFMPVPDSHGKLAVMPGAVLDPACFGVKLVSKFPGSAAGSHVGAVMLFDGRDGSLLALVEGGTLTAIRTAAASALATDLLANPDAAALLVCGTGEQARRHVAAMRAVRPIERTLVWGRDVARVATFAREIDAEAAGDLAEAVGEADLICTATAAITPYLEGAWLSPGQHLNLVGAAVASSAEIDGAAVARSRVFVDYRPATAVAAGELIDAGALGDVVAEIGEVAAGHAVGRRNPSEITMYKSLGVTAQDLFAAHAVYLAARRRGLGREIELAA